MGNSGAKFELPWPWNTDFGEPKLHCSPVEHFYSLTEQRVCLKYTGVRQREMVTARWEVCLYGPPFCMLTLLALGVRKPVFC